MAHFAPVAPIQILKQFEREGILGNYHLLLAHDIIKPENKAYYHEVFGKREWEGTVILDNSIIELGDAVDLDVIGQAAEIVNADVIVLPDVLEDGPATTSKILGAYDEWEEFFDTLLGATMYRFMLVPQGKTVEEFETCAATLADFDNGIWGIPRNTVKLHGTRRHAIDICHELEEAWDIHLLGFSDSLADDIAMSKHYASTGIDSAVPIRAASIGHSFESVANGLEMPPRGIWWDEASYVPMMADNLRSARKIFKQGE